MIFSNNFFGFAFSFILSALSYNFESGAGEALIYDSLKSLGEENKFIKLTGHYETIFQIAGIISLIIGGYIGILNYTWVFYIAIVITIITLIIGFLFEEPPIENKKEIITFKETIKNQYIDSFNIIRTKKKLFYLIIFSSLLSIIITLSFFYLQINWKNSGYNELKIGINLALSSAFAVIGSLISEKIDKKFGEINLLKIIPLIISICILSFYNTFFSIFEFCIICFFDSLLFVALRDYINKIIPSDKRATIISFESTCFSLFMIFIFPLFGYLSDKIGMGICFFILGILMIILAIFNIYILNIKTNKKITSNKI